VAQGFFVTGTNTEIGKTYLACCLIETLNALQNKPVYARKPIASGAIRFTAQKLISEDAMRLKKACRNDETLNQICPYLFEEAISPARAIKLNNAKISFKDLVQACDFPQAGIGIIEGAGGFLSPLVDEQLNQHLAQALKLPVVIVVGNQLGCINQALLTLQAVEAADLTVAVMIVNDLSVDADIENYHDLKALVSCPCIHTPYQPQQIPIVIDALNHLLDF